MKNRLGFTLVELLIVLAIVGILGAIGIPSYNRYVARSKRMECTAFLASVNMGEWAYVDNFGYSINFAFCPNPSTANLPQVTLSGGVETKPILILPSTERDKYCDMSSTVTHTVDGASAQVARSKNAEVYYRYSIRALRVGVSPLDISGNLSADIQGGPLFPTNITNPDNPKWKTGDVNWSNNVGAATKATPPLVEPILKDQFMIGCVGQLDDDDVDDIVIQDHIRRTFIASDDIRE